MLRPATTALLAVALAALALPSAASGGAYTAVQCNQTLNPGPGQAISEQTSAGYFLSAGCATGAGLVIEDRLLASTPGSSYGRWVWRAPGGTVFTDIRASSLLVDGVGGAQARLRAVQAGGEITNFGTPGAVWDPADTVSGEFSELRAELRCEAPAQCDTVLLPQARTAIRDVFLRIADRSDPVVGIGGGSLFPSDAVRGSQRASFQVTDEGGGVREIELRVNGELAYNEVRDCEIVAGVAIALQPCSGQVGATVTLETSSAPFTTGVNEVAACGSDLAFEGLPSNKCERQEVFVDNLCPTSEVGAGSDLSGGFKKGRKTARVHSNERARVVGKLRSDSGDGIADAKVCALTRVQMPGAPFEVADTAKTRSDGRYVLRLPAGASREVVVDRAFGNEVLSRPGLAVRSSVKPTFEVKPRKQGRIGANQRLRFSGRLPGPACDGRIVKIQAKVSKRAWQVFRTVRTNDKCAYRARYKLRSTSSRTRYLFRAQVPEQRDYPYTAGASTVRARVAGSNRG